jgi:uncharacterized protein (TIGR02118 family)
MREAAMPTLVVLYPTPTDVAAFDRRYQEEHVRLVKSHLGMAKFRAHPVLGVVGNAGSPPPYHLMVELEFASAKDMEKALQSTGGQATAAHATEISSGGAPVMLIVG